MTVDAAADEIRDEFAFLDDWEMRYSHIIDLGKQLPDLPESEKTDAHKVKGCASQVWFTPLPDPAAPHVLRFRAQSDAMIVSGLIAVLTRLFNEQRASEVLAFDAEAFFEDLGIKDALSAQRTNGLHSMLARIRQFAETAQAGAPASS